MKTTVASRITAALCSVTITLCLLDAIAIYGHPRPAESATPISANSTTVVASTSK
jgi:hypothetical protein